MARKGPDSDYISYSDAYEWVKECESEYNVKLVVNLSFVVQAGRMLSPQLRIAAGRSRPYPEVFRVCAGTRVSFGGAGRGTCPGALIRGVITVMSQLDGMTEAERDAGAPMPGFPAWEQMELPIDI